VTKHKGPRQPDFFPPPAHRYQSLDELDAIAVKCAEKAKELHDDYRHDPRAARALFNAFIIWGAIEILKKRGYPNGR
jgi:hypothetical protein